MRLRNKKTLFLYLIVVTVVLQNSCIENLYAEEYSSYNVSESSYGAAFEDKFEKQIENKKYDLLKSFYNKSSQTKVDNSSRYSNPYDDLGDAESNGSSFNGNNAVSNSKEMLEKYYEIKNEKISNTQTTKEPDYKTKKSALKNENYFQKNEKPIAKTSEEKKIKKPEENISKSFQHQPNKDNKLRITSKTKNDSYKTYDKTDKLETLPDVSKVIEKHLEKQVEKLPEPVDVPANKFSVNEKENENQVIASVVNTQKEKETEHIQYAAMSSDRDYYSNAFSSTGSYYDDLEEEPDFSKPAEVVQQKKEMAKAAEAISEVPIDLAEVNLGISKDAKKISLPESIELALLKNLNIQITDSRKVLSKWRFVQSLAEFLPDVNLAYSHSRYQGTILVGGVLPTKVLRTSIIPSLTAQATVFKGLETFFGAISAKHTYNASKDSLHASIQETLFSVTDSYNTLIRDRATVLVVEKALDDTKEQLKINEERLYAGVGTKLDVLQSESLVSQAEQRLIEARNSYRLSMVMFTNLVGIDIFDELIPVEDTVERANLLPESVGIDDIVEVALMNRPEIERDRHLLRSLINQRRAAFSVYLPHASVSGGLQGSGQKLNEIRRSQFISLNLEWNGLTNLGTQGLLRSKEVGAQIKEANLTLENTIRNIQEEVVSSFYSRDSAKKLIEVATKSVNSSEESLRLAKIRLQAGVGNNLDYISAQVEYARVKVDLINAIVDYNNSEAELLKVMGVINLDHLTRGITTDELHKLKIPEKKS